MIFSRWMGKKDKGSTDPTASNLSPLEQLRIRAGDALVQADNAVRAADEEQIGRAHV